MQQVLLGGLILSIFTSYSYLSQADKFTEALSAGKAYGDFRLRYEAADQDNSLDDANALTLRSRLGYKTGAIDGFSATMEVEDNRIIAGVGDYTVGPSGYNLGEYSVIADPETTELDQGFIQYQTKSSVTRVGRQVLTLDNHRYVGHVGWRQDRQTFDALSTKIEPIDNLTVQYAYIGQRNRIFAEDADFDSKDHLLNVAYKTPVGKLTGYTYLLEIDNNINNAIDTFGVRFVGSKPVGDTTVSYTAEYAVQDVESGATEFDTDYLLLEGGVTINAISLKAGIEILGSDDGNFGFAAPLATMHKFNGWADRFLMTPAQGLVDVSVSAGGKIANGQLAGGKWLVRYHDFEADKSTAGVDDLGSEIDVSFHKSFGKNYYAGVKYASYSAGDIKVDTDILWVWVGVKF